MSAAFFSLELSSVRPTAHCKYLRSDYDQIAVIRRVSIPKYCHSQDQMIGSNFYYFSYDHNFYDLFTIIHSNHTITVLPMVVHYQ